MTETAAPYTVNGDNMHDPLNRLVTHPVIEFTIAHDDTVSVCVTSAGTGQLLKANVIVRELSAKELEAAIDAALALKGIAETP